MHTAHQGREVNFFLHLMPQECGCSQPCLRSVDVTMPTHFDSFHSVTRVNCEHRRKKGYPIAEGSALIQVQSILDVEYLVNYSRRLAHVNLVTFYFITHISEWNRVIPSCLLRNNTGRIIRHSASFEINLTERDN